ncbi:precorrin-8X methylmutase [Desulforhopalus singaporensis]|uniref:Precorrin-8X methylmutase n=1 Tax=Desulforhopalus singaporensis TaxID=91360 RepID=A0A1H0NX06_9BACT|nr:precorrin-8X methylmutase [Desulforhopalus singaporensis]SDO97214.1 precorrin-8X methylmutase [Desulforhopalus singaporensis]
MSVKLQEVAPGDIEQESFNIIEKELGPTEFDPATFKIVQRVIHATGDFSFAENMRFAPGAIEAGIKALKAGKNILTDVNMVAAGINKTMLARFGGEVICKVADQEVARKAKEEGTTRSEMAISMYLDESIGIVAMGNAPTALVASIKKVKEMSEPPLLVGVPVGFVNAAESKALLVEQNNCYITSLGRKGGSPIAAAIINAMMKLAAK